MTRIASRKPAPRSKPAARSSKKPAARSTAKPAKTASKPAKSARKPARTSGKATASKAPSRNTSSFAKQPNPRPYEKPSEANNYNGLPRVLFERPEPTQNYDYDSVREGGGKNSGVGYHAAQRNFWSNNSQNSVGNGEGREPRVSILPIGRSGGSK